MCVFHLPRTSSVFSADMVSMLIEIRGYSGIVGVEVRVGDYIDDTVESNL